MTALDHNPPTLNFLPALDFKLVIRRCPTVEFFAQRCNLPGITGSSVSVPTPLATIKRNYDKLEYHSLNIAFKVDELMTNYLEIHKWMCGLAPQHSFKPYAQLQQQGIHSGVGLYSDISIMYLDSEKNPVFEVIYKDAFPTSMSDLHFEIDKNDVKYHTCEVTFDYTLYDIKVLL